MNQSFMGVTHPIKNNKGAVISSIIALVAAVISLFQYFMYGINGNYEFVFPEFEKIIQLIVFITPFVLLALYLYKFVGTANAKNIIIAVYAVLAATPWIERIINSAVYDIDFGDAQSIIYALIYTAGFGVAAYFVYAGLADNRILIGVVAAGAVIKFLEFIDTFEYYEMLIDFGFGLFVFFDVTYYIALFAIYVAVTMLVLESKKTVAPAPAAGFAPTAAPTSTAGAAQALATLNEMRANGTISEEEYMARRAQILRNI